jgi:hypothetical protein
MHPPSRLSLEAFEAASPSSKWLALGVLMAAAWGCSSPAEPVAAEAAPTGNNGTTPLGRARCQAPAGTTGSPHTIEEAVQLMNALPKPTSVACFVESLDRPLTAFATKSIFSAQPAQSARSPRVFLQLSRLWISIVIDGQSSSLVEFGYLAAGERLQTIKAELELPLEAPVGPSAPYDRVLLPEGGNGTICGLCHFGERKLEDITFANVYASEAFRPRADSYVSIESLQVESQLCDVRAQPQRCEMLAALFDGGLVTESPFPDAMETFF